MTQVILYDDDWEILASWPLGDSLPDFTKWLPASRECQYQLEIGTAPSRFMYSLPRGPLRLAVQAAIDEHQGGPKRQPSYTEPEPELIATVLNRIEGKLDKMLAGDRAAAVQVPGAIEIPEGYGYCFVCGIVPMPPNDTGCDHAPPFVIRPISTP